MDNQTYTLVSENEKLEVRARLFDRQSKPFLQRIISPGQHIFEIGCGMGGATNIMANLLDNTGFILAIDINPDYVSYVERKLRAQGFHNFVIRQQQAEHIEDKNKYDVVYGRAVLHHIPEAKEVMHKLFSMLKPGGLIAFEEPIMNTALVQPEDKNFTKLFNWYIKLGQLRHCNYLIGQDLPLYFQEMKINLLSTQIIQIAMIEPREREVILELIDTLESQIIAANIASRDEINQLRRDLGKLIHSQHLIYNVQFCQVLGQKQAD